MTEKERFHTVYFHTVYIQNLHSKKGRFGAGMRLVFSRSFLSCFAGILLFLAHSVAGQGTRELIPLTPSQPPQIPTTAPLAGRAPSTLPNSRVQGLFDLSGGTTSPSHLPPGNLNSGGLPLGGPLPSVPSGMSSIPFTAPPAPAEDQHTTPLSILPARVLAVLELETEEDREERELRIQRHRAEQIVDPERRQFELGQVERNEANYQNRLALRQADEVGADLFYHPRLKARLLQEGWCQLFDGHTDFGWQIQTEGPYGGGNFTFGEHEICSDPFNPGMVYTKIPFGDVSLRFDYWAEKDSEVFLLLKTPPDPEDLNSSCYTFILNSSHSNRPRGLLLGRHGLPLADLRTMRTAWDDPANEEEGTWHSVRVSTERNALGDHLHIWLDRRAATTYFVDKPLLSGHIAFLVTKGKARFQSILWKPNLPVAIFDEENRFTQPWQHSESADFTGSHQTSFRLFSGSVESKDLFGNFVLQMQYYQGSNSGQSSLFVRSLPEIENTGYEISLQNNPRRIDRATARGVDAGGFLQSKDARYIRAQDHEWTHLTVAAMDRHIQTWVNGVPVCNINDQRSIRENMPIDRRRDPFLKPGTIRLSVPEDNTAFQFRQLVVMEIPAQ